MSINAIAALSLRKPDHNRNNANLSSNASEAGSRFGNKRSNMKEILVRNFFRKYPLDRAINDTQQLKIERFVASEMDNFVSTAKAIDSKNLHQFEMKLAQDVKLNKVQVQQHASPMAKITKHNGQSASNVRMSSQRQDFLRKNQSNAVDGQFQLPSINSHAALILKNKSIEAQPGQSLRGRQDGANRRSQVAKQTMGSPENAYGGKHSLTKQPSGVGIRQQRTVLNTFDNRNKGGNDMQMNKSGMRNLSLAHQGADHTLSYPMTTKEMGATGMRNSNSLMANIGGLRANLQDKGSTAIPTNRSTQLTNQKKKRAIKDGYTVQAEVENLPSDISDDEWGEIQKFGQRLYEEQQKKQKVAAEIKRKQVKDVLDQQVKLRAELREKNQKERQDFDKRLLDKARQELDEERQQKADLQLKVMEQKHMRDQVLKESTQKRVDEQQRHANDEKARQAKLIKDLAQEQEQKAVRKVQERKAAMKVIKDNMFEKKKRMQDIEMSKKADADQVEVNMRVAVEKERKREQEIAARGKRIQAMMDSMGEVIRDNSKELELKAEKKYIEQCIARDESQRLAQIQEKTDKRKMHMDLNQQLNSQITEKKMKMDNDMRANKSYMNQWIQQTQVADQSRSVIEATRKQKVVANANFLKNQMGLNGVTGNASANGSSVNKLSKKQQLGGLMNPEEAKMNRALLQEIGRVKRGDEPTGLLAAATNNPI